MAHPAPSSVSWWLTDAMGTSLSRAIRPLIGDITVDVVIVGGGFTGLWTALALKERAPGLSITLIEANICGAGASGKNGGKAHGYWASLVGLSNSIGDDKALELARLGSAAQDKLRDFATARGRDVWWREGGNLCVSAAPAQDVKISQAVGAARRLGVPDSAIAISQPMVAVHCRSPVFRGGVFFPESATVHPARLALALRDEVIKTGVHIFEHTRMIRYEAGSTICVHTPKGRIVSRDLVLATNVALATDPHLRKHISVFSSYALMTDPCSQGLADMGWTGDVGMADLRMFLHYFRKTDDGRVLMGSGSGPISPGGRVGYPALENDTASVRRAAQGLRRLLPALQQTGIARAWGGAIDVAADRLPIIRTLPGKRIHYACGFCGHGVNPSCLAGQTLASLVLRTTDEWSTSPLVTRNPARLPPEPFRSIGGRAIRSAILKCEEASEADRRAPLLARATAALPALLGLKIGVR